MFAWGLYLLDTGAWPGVVAPIVQTVVYLGNLVLTARSRRTKVLIVRALQRRLVNPLVRVLFSVGIYPLGVAIRLNQTTPLALRSTRVPSLAGTKLFRALDVCVPVCQNEVAPTAMTSLPPGRTQIRTSVPRARPTRGHRCG